MNRKPLIPLYRAVREYGFQPVKRPTYTQNGCCQWCGNTLPPRRKSFCCEECSKEYWDIVAFKRSRSGYSNHIVWRDNCTCQDCGAFLAYQNDHGIYIPLGINAEVHHILPVSMGGTDDPKNLITLCHNCHVKRHKMMKRKES